MQKITKVLLVLSAGLLLAGVPSGFAIHYNKQYNDLKNSEQVQSNQGLLSVIEELQASLKSTKSELTQVTAKLNNKTAENEANKALVEDLKAQVNSLQAKGDADEETIKSLNTQIAEQEKKIISDTATITSLTQDIENLNTRIDILTDNVDKLSDEKEENILQLAVVEEQLAEAMNEITRLNGLLEDYQDISELVYQVSFYMGETNLHTDAAKFGTTLGELLSDLVLPENHGITGWKIADGTPVNEDYVVTENVDFYAEYTQVNYYLGGTVLKSFNITEDDQLFENAPRSTNTYRIDGYKNAEGIDVDLTALSVVEDTNFYADYSVIITPTEEEISAYLSSFTVPTGTNLKSVLFCQYDVETGDVDILFKTTNTRGEENVFLLPFNIGIILNPMELTFSDIVEQYLAKGDSPAGYNLSTLFISNGETFEDGLFAHIETVQTTLVTTQSSFLSDSVYTLSLKGVAIYKNSNGEIIDVKLYKAESRTCSTEEYETNSETYFHEMAEELYNTYVKDKTYLYA